MSVNSDKVWIVKSEVITEKAHTIGAFELILLSVWTTIGLYQSRLLPVKKGSIYIYRLCGGVSNLTIYLLSCLTSRVKVMV